MLLHSSTNQFFRRTAPHRPLGSLQQRFKKYLGYETHRTTWISETSVQQSERQNKVVTDLVLTLVPFTVETVHGALVRKLPQLLLGTVVAKGAATYQVVNVRTWHQALLARCTFVIILSIAIALLWNRVLLLCLRVLQLSIHRLHRVWVTTSDKHLGRDAIQLLIEGEPKEFRLADYRLKSSSQGERQQVEGLNCCVCTDAFLFCNATDILWWCYEFGGIQCFSCCCCLLKRGDTTEDPFALLN